MGRLDLDHAGIDAALGHEFRMGALLGNFTFSAASSSALFTLYSITSKLNAIFDFCMI